MITESAEGNPEQPQPAAPTPVRVDPIGGDERIASLDVLRGFAVLGILVMNIQAFSMIFSAYMNPTTYGDLDGANWWVWLLCHVLTDQKFMTIFSMLFGAGIIVFTSRAEARGRKSAGLHYRRMAWLILFGLLHAHLLWFGDILYTYGMCGLLAFLFRRLAPKWLILIGVAAIAVPSVLSILFGWSMQFWPEEQIQVNAQMWAPSAEAIAQELNTYRGSWLEQLPERVKVSAMFETMIFLIFIAWRAGGLMLIGMALFKMGVFSAARSKAFYATLIAIGVLVGIPVIGYGVKRNYDVQWDYAYSMFYGGLFNYWASILVSLAWVSIVMLVCRAGAVRWLTDLLAAVGRMAFTNYLMQTVICTTLFYGHGFGLFGELSRVEQIGVVFAVWAVELVWSPIWLRYFRFGPAEWLWRSLSYWRRQPMRV